MRKGFKPWDNVARQRRRSRNECDVIDAKSRSFQPRCVVAGSRKIPRYVSFPVHAPPIQRVDKRGSDLVYAAIASTFGNEAAPRSKRAVHGADHPVGWLDPVQDSVAEHSIELFPERQSFGVNNVRVQPKFPGRLNLRRARIDGNNFTAEINQFFRECAVSTTEVKNALTGSGCQ